MRRSMWPLIVRTEIVHERAGRAWVDRSRCDISTRRSSSEFRTWRLPPLPEQLWRLMELGGVRVVVLQGLSQATPVVAAVEEVAQLCADLAALRFAISPLVGVDAKCGVGFSVSESALDVNEVVVECDQHAGVTVAEVVKGGFWCRELGGYDGAVECGAVAISSSPRRNS
jgi:hypothetical protein